MPGRARARRRPPPRRAASTAAGSPRRLSGWRRASSSRRPKATRASPRSPSGCSTPSRARRPASASSGRSPGPRPSRTTCSRCCSRTTASISPTRTASGVTYDDVRADPDAALATIVRRYKAVEALCDAVVILGSDYTDVGSPAELAYNARIAANLGAPVLLVLGGRALHGPGRAARHEHGAHRGRDGPDRRPRPHRAVPRPRRSCSPSSPTAPTPTTSPGIVAAIRGSVDAASQAAGPRGRVVPVWALPEDRFLVAPSIRGILRSVEGTLIKGDPGAAHPRGARRRRRRHVDGQRAARGSPRGRSWSSPPIAPRCCWRRCWRTPPAPSPRSPASC